MYRLAEYTIALPPLRERTTDVGYLAQRFLEEAGVELRRPVQGIAPGALSLLAKQPWPGNVRELRNLVRRAVLQSNDAVVSEALVRSLLVRPAAAPKSVPPLEERSLKEIGDTAAREAERVAICATLEATLGNKAQAARLLRTDYKTLHNRIRDLGIRQR